MRSTPRGCPLFPVFFHEYKALRAGWRKLGRDGGCPRIPSIEFSLEFLEPSPAEGDVVDLVFEDLRHQRRALFIAEMGKRFAVHGGEIEIGHFKGEAHDTDVADRRGEIGNVISKNGGRGEGRQTAGRVRPSVSYRV